MMRDKHMKMVVSSVTIQTFSHTDKNVLIGKCGKQIVRDLTNTSQNYKLYVLIILEASDSICVLLGLSKAIELLSIYVGSDNTVGFGWEDEEFILILTPSSVIEVALHDWFVEFVSYNEQEFLVIGEIGVLMVSTEGKMKWSFSKDVITGYKIDKDTIILTFMDEPSVIINLNNGDLV
jgi:hypothetical protein